MYIKKMTEENKNIYVSYWLLLITLLVCLMIVIGGLTRLTESGLSITRWDLISGIIPPLSINDWNELFSLYKKIPEYQLLKPNMSLEEFKIIYWWEYSHRILGRLIGLLYLIPLLFFTWKNTLNKKKLFNYYFVLFFICFQGFIGWYMVQSGLTERTDVSHYRLSLHLIFAFLILIFLLWNFLDLSSSKKSFEHKFSSKIITVFFVLLLIQIGIGAFVSGLDAGKIYQTWPTMNGVFFPDDSNIKDLFSLNVFDNPSLVQFIHRIIAYFIFVLFLIIFYKVFSNNNYLYLRKNVIWVFLALVFQIFLGILTILSGVQIILASLHQIGSIFLVVTSLILVFKSSKTN